MRRRCISRSVSLPLWEMGGTSVKPEKRESWNCKWEGRARTCAESIPGAGVLHFGMTVISRGQHETAPLEEGLLSLDGARELLPEWWQFSMSSISSR